MALTSRVCLLVATTVAAIAGGCAGNRARTDPQAQTQTQSRSTVTPIGGAVKQDTGHRSTATLVVHGMGCPLCANNVDKQLLKVAGVEKVNVDLGSGKVKVSFASGAARPGDDKLAKAVANSGYTLVRIQTP